MPTIEGGFSTANKRDMLKAIEHVKMPFEELTTEKFVYKNANMEIDLSKELKNRKGVKLMSEEEVNEEDKKEEAAEEESEEEAFEKEEEEVEEEEKPEEEAKEE